MICSASELGANSINCAEESNLVTRLTCSEGSVSSSSLGSLDFQVYCSSCKYSTRKDEFRRVLYLAIEFLPSLLTEISVHQLCRLFRNIFQFVLSSVLLFIELFI